MDRIDIQIEVSAVGYKNLNNNQVEEKSSEIRKRVNLARKIQLKRYDKLNIFSNSQLSSGQINKYCVVNKESKSLLKSAFENLGLSARAYNKILKLSRTIADLEGFENIETKHIAEAIQYRSLDRKYWGR